MVVVPSTRHLNFYSTSRLFLPRSTLERSSSQPANQPLCEKDQERASVDTTNDDERQQRRRRQLARSVCISAYRLSSSHAAQRQQSLVSVSIRSVRLCFIACDTFDTTRHGTAQYDRITGWTSRINREANNICLIILSLIIIPIAIAIVIVTICRPPRRTTANSFILSFSSLGRPTNCFLSINSDDFQCIALAPP